MSHRPSVARVVVALLFAVSGSNQLVQVPGELLGSDGIRTLGLLHLLAGLSGFATAWGAWRAARWAWLAAIAWAAATATLILSLETLLRLPPDDAQGFVPAAIVVLCIGAAAAWYLFRVARRREGNADALPRD